jgi:hypothetical protein
MGDCARRSRAAAGGGVVPEEWVCLARAKKKQVSRLRKMARFACHLASLEMTESFNLRKMARSAGHFSLEMRESFNSD